MRVTFSTEGGGIVRELEVSSTQQMGDLLLILSVEFEIPASQLLLQLNGNEVGLVNDQEVGDMGVVDEDLIIVMRRIESGGLESKSGEIGLEDIPRNVKPEQLLKMIGLWDDRYIDRNMIICDCVVSRGSPPFRGVISSCWSRSEQGVEGERCH